MAGGVEFTYTVVGHNRVANRFRRAASKGARLYDKAMGRWAQGVRRKLKGTPYPPPRPNQKYKRTGRLASSWAARRVGAGRYAIVNRAAGRSGPYAVYVVGDRRGSGQAWMHVGRWWKAKNIIEEELPGLRRVIVDSIAEEVGG